MPELARAAREARWESDPDRSARVTRAIYLRLSPGARLWLHADQFSVAEPDALKAALAG